MCSTRELRFIALCLLAATGSSFSTPSKAARSHSCSFRRFQLCATLPLNEDEIDRSLVEAATIYSFPVAAAVASFNLYEQISKSFHGAVQVLSHNNWIPVDGGQLIGDIILPATNGPVLSSIGLLFATLVATTIGNLYNRLTQLRSSFIRELDDLRRLGFLLESMPNPYRQQCHTELKIYCDNLLDAVKARTFSTEAYRQNDMNGLFLLLNEIAKCSESNDSVVVPGAVLGEAYELVRRLGDHRTAQRALLLSEFPPLHYVNLISLGSSICFIFLLETDRDLIFFLAGFQLRILWSVLIGTFAMMAAVIYDLSSPFGGSYSMADMSDQHLESIKEYISVSLED